MTTIAELFANVGFKIDESNLLKFKIGLVGTAAAILKFTADVVKATVELDNFEKRTGVSSQLVSEWQLVAKTSNVSADSINGAFESIAQARANILTGNGNIKPWALLGVDPTQDPEVVFQKVLDSLNDIQDVGVRTKRIADIGLDPQINNLIGKTKDSIGSLNKSLMQTSEEKKAMLDLNKSFNELKITLSLIKEKFASYFFPIKSLIDLFKRMIDITISLAEKLGGLKKVITAIGLIFGILFIAVFPMTALFIGLALIIEDVWTYFEGGESVLGKLIDKFPILGDIIKGITAVVKSLKEAFGFLVAYFKDDINFQVENLIKNFKFLINILETVMGFIKGIGEFSGKIISKFIDKDTDKKNQESDDRIKNYLEKKGVDYDEFQNNLKNNFAPSDPSSNNISNINQENTITFNGIQNPQEMADKIKPVLNFEDNLNSSSLQLLK